MRCKNCIRNIGKKGIRPFCGHCVSRLNREKKETLFSMERFLVAEIQSCQESISQHNTVKFCVLLPYNFGSQWELDQYKKRIEDWVEKKSVLYKELDMLCTKLLTVRSSIGYFIVDKNTEA